jgi:hypothetical protein
MLKSRLKFRPCAQPICRYRHVSQKSIDPEQKITISTKDFLDLSEEEVSGLKPGRTGKNKASQA